MVDGSSTMSWQSEHRTYFPKGMRSVSFNVELLNMRRYFTISLNNGLFRPFLQAARRMIIAFILEGGSTLYVSHANCVHDHWKFRLNASLQD